ncbi:MAG: hypothetical protein QNJ09_00235 [Paracoccaceae bacterium]|nr:hypothetical protein [Paracoccaceae bacterium]
MKAFTLAILLSLSAGGAALANSAPMSLPILTFPAPDATTQGCSAPATGQIVCQ